MVPSDSVSDERGLPYCPAMRPTFTIGTPDEYMSTTAICRMTRSLSRMLSAENVSNDSAQSPACSRKASPRGHLGQALGQDAGLAGEHQRRHGGQRLDGAVEVGLIGPVRLLLGRMGVPRVRGPGRVHGVSTLPDRVGPRKAFEARAGADR